MVVADMVAVVVAARDEEPKDARAEAVDGEVRERVVPEREAQRRVVRLDERVVRLVRDARCHFLIGVGVLLRKPLLPRVERFGNHSRHVERECTIGEERVSQARW